MHDFFQEYGSLLLDSALEWQVFSPPYGISAATSKEQP